MAAQKGSALLLKIGADASAAAASDTYTTVGGLRSTSITLNQESVDITNKDSANARELLADAGVESVSISGSGVFTDAASEGTLRTAFGGANIPTLKSLFQTWEHTKASSTLHHWSMAASTTAKLLIL